MERYDIVVLGGGAAGLMAAVSAAEAGNGGLRVSVLEGNARVGKKLLATGNGRCNLSNRFVAPTHYHGDTSRVAGLLKRFPTEKVVGQFAHLGLLCRELDEGRIYPYSLQAASVLEVLRLHLEQRGVVVQCGTPVTEVRREKGGFCLQCDGKWLQAARVIFATGGLAYPQLGANDSGYRMLRALGHTVTALRPALVQIRTEPRRAKPLKGMRSSAEVTLLVNHRPVQTAKGEVQFTEHGLSGICMFELSRKAGECLERKMGPVELGLDLMSEYTEPQILSMLYRTIERLPDLPGGELLGGLLNRTVGREVLRTALPQTPKAAAHFSKGQLTAVSRMIKCFRFPVLGLLSWDSAQVTAGGVPLGEVDCRTMESRTCRGLYLAGELLNVDGDCGGYNLHWAWSTGMAAGRASAHSLQNGISEG